VSSGPLSEKVVFIGLGAFGYDVLIQLKRALRALAEEGGRDSEALWDRDVRFLAIDFSPRTELPPGEHLELEIVGQSPDWPTAGLDPAVTVDGGSRGSPSYAAQAWLAAISRESEMLGRLRNLTDGLGLGGGTTCRYYVVCSVAEPQGAGLLLAVAGLVRRMAHSEGRRELLSQCAMMIVPPGLDLGEKAQVAATLREVVQAEGAGWPAPVTQDLQRDPAEGEQHVFSLGCYLVEPAQEGEGASAPTTGAHMCRLVAEWLAYMALPPVVEGLRQAGLVTPRRSTGLETAEVAGYLEGLPEGYARPAFSSLGLADYVVPVGGVIERCARRLAVRLVGATLLDDPGEAGLDQAEAFISLAKLSPMTLATELAAMQPGRPMDRPLAEDEALNWKKRGDIAEAWRRRESMEKQDLPANTHDLAIRVETRVAEVGRKLHAEALSVAGRNPLGAFDRVLAFLAETRARLLGLETGIRADCARVQTAAERLFSVLPARKVWALCCEAQIRPLWHASGWFAVAGIVLLAIDTICRWVLKIDMPDTVFRMTTSGVWYILWAAIYLLLALWCTRVAQRHVAEVRKYLSLVTRHHLLEAVASLLRGVKSGALDVERLIGNLKRDVEGLAARLRRRTPSVVNTPSTDGAPGFLDFPGRDSLVTEAMESDLYDRASGAIQLGENAALRALAMEVFSPPDGLANWLSEASAERDEKLLMFCRARFRDCGLPDAETLFVDRLLEGGSRPQSEADEIAGQELAARFLRRMQPRSSHGPLATKPSQVIGLPTPEWTRLRVAIDKLHRQRGQLYEIGTGLRFRIIGLSFRHDLRLENLRAYADFEAAYAKTADPNVYHTRLVFSGRESPSSGAKASWAEGAWAGKPGGRETEDGDDQAWAEPGDTGSAGGDGEPETAQAGSTWSEDWSNVPEAFPETDTESGPRPGEPGAVDSAYRLFGLEPGASADKVEDAYWNAHCLYNTDTGTQKSVETMARFNAAYDCIKATWRAAA